MEAPQGRLAAFECPRCGASTEVWLLEAPLDGAELVEECSGCLRDVRLACRVEGATTRLVPVARPQGSTADFDPSGSYRCPSCFESIDTWIDPENGSRQEYVEDCPVCCRPNLVRARIGPDGALEVEASAE
jgi:NAD-dependent SIR2 family protein deacetylase